MNEVKKKFSDLPEHTRMFLNGLKADVNYLKQYTAFGDLNDKLPYKNILKQYEDACRAEGVEPYET